MPCLSDSVVLSAFGLNAWRPKDPVDYRQFSADFSQVMQAGSSITNLQVLSFDATVLIGQQSFKGTVAQFYLGGGINGAVTEIAIKAVTNAGETIVQTVQLPVISRLWPSANPPFSPPAGAPGSIDITDQTTGNPLSNANGEQPITLP